MIELSVHVPSRTVVVGARRFRAESIVTDDVGWHAWLKLAPRVHARVRADGSDVALELWAGEPERSKGLAVVMVSGRLGTAAIPPCTCGEVECAHIHRQYRVTMDAVDLAGTLEALESMPEHHVDLDRAEIWLEPLGEAR